MMHSELLLPFARTIVGALGAGVLESALLACVILGVTKLRPRPSATTRHVFWWSALVASVALPIASIAVSFGHVEHRRVVEASAPQAVSATFLLERAKRTESANAELGAAQTVPTVAYEIADAHVPSQAPARQGVDLSGAREALAGALSATARVLTANEFGVVALALVAVWLVVAALGLATLSRSFLTLRALKRGASALDENVVRRLRRWRHASRNGRPVALAVSNEVDVPVAVGFRRPTILLPIQVVEREEIADIDQIAMHEYAHLNRRDDWTNLIQRFLERVFWFNPIVAFMGRRIALEREIACDDWVVAQTGRAHRYATCLWRLVESSRLPAKELLAPGALQSPKQITVRIEQLLDARRNGLPRLSLAGTFAVALLCVALVVFQAQRAPVIALTEKVAPAAAQSRQITTASAPRSRGLTTIARVDVTARAKSPLVAKAPATPRTSKRAAASALPSRVAPAATVEHETLLAVADVPSLPTAAPIAPLGDATPVPAPSARVNVERRIIELKTIRRPDVEALRAELRKAMEQLRASDDDASRKAVESIRAKLEAVLKSLHEFNGLPGGYHVFVPPTFVTPKGFDFEGPHDLESIHNCVGCAFPNSKLRGIVLNGRSLVGVSLRGADLTGSTLSGVRLVGVDLENARLDGSDLRNATLVGCNLRHASLKNARLDGITITGSNLEGIALAGTSIRPILEGCKNCSFHGLDLRGQDLRNLHLIGSSLRGIDLRNADLSGSTLESVDLGQARLDGANLSNVKLLGCSLRSTSLRGANMTGLTIDNSRTLAPRFMFRENFDLKKKTVPLHDLGPTQNNESEVRLRVFVPGNSSAVTIVPPTPETN